jgi:COX assembly mitochondrial protein 1
MNALSRREEETLLKTTKARALRECDDFVKGRVLALLKVVL